MAHLRCDFRSDAMGMNTSMTVILPEKTDLSQVPVVYLLHGLEDNCTGWARYTSVERYAREKNAALVMPEVQRSFYADMDRGLPYFTFIHDELPEICRGFFGFSAKREKNYLMGLSMGGYGTLKCVLQTPERYAGAAAFSAVADIEEFVAVQTPAEKRELQAVFGQSGNSGGLQSAGVGGKSGCGAAAEALHGLRRAGRSVRRQCAAGGQADGAGRGHPV